ncbi:transmembrane protein [Favolaschia claudopus]|uniref:Transmembrane protein n=1 Tax=Favolaschia claudopus TaxID=2862362 RepID=A0AAW0API2_9AGAR
MDSESVVLLLFLLLFCVASYAILFSAFLPLTGIFILDVLALDTHYKYVGIFLIPTTAYFVIANWVGWQYYRNS